MLKNGDENICSERIKSNRLRRRKNLQVVTDVRPFPQQRLFIKNDVAKKDIPADETRKERSSFPRGAMVCLCCARMGGIRPCFVDDNCGVAAQIYVRILKFDVIPQIKRLARTNGWGGKARHWKQGGGASHTAPPTLKFLESACPQLVRHPPNSPGLSPLDSSINALAEATSGETPPDTASADDICSSVVGICKGMDQPFIDSGVDGWATRLVKCVAAIDGYSEKK